MGFLPNGFWCVHTLISNWPWFTTLMHEWVVFPIKGQCVGATQKALKQNDKVQTGPRCSQTARAAFEFDTLSTRKKIKITLKQSSWAYKQPWIEGCNMWVKYATQAQGRKTLACRIFQQIWTAQEPEMVLPSYQQYSYICNLITLHLNKLSLSNQYPADKSLKNTLPSLCPSRKVAGDMMLCIVMLCYGCERFCSYPLSLQQLQGFLPLFSATCLRNDLNHQLSQHLWASQAWHGLVPLTWIHLEQGTTIWLLGGITKHVWHIVLMIVKESLVHPLHNRKKYHSKTSIRASTDRWSNQPQAV